MLRVRNLRSYYGPLEALHNVDLEVGAKDIVCLIGSNGAGKTTLLKSISGMIRRDGEIYFQNQNIEHATPRTIARKGIIHVPEGRHVFPGLTVALTSGCPKAPEESIKAYKPKSLLSSLLKT